MFCHKCGTEIADGAGFCHKCGTKVATIETEQSTPREIINTPLSVEQNAQPEAIPAAILSDDSRMFKEFVDNHVRTTTKYQSAQELLDSRVSLSFVWICLGVSIVIGVLTLNVALLIAILLIGYIASNIVGALKKGRYAFRFQGVFTRPVDQEHLIQYLNTHLGKLSPNFHQWGIMNRVGSGVRGRAIAAVSNEVSKDLGEIALCTPFGSDQLHLSVIYIRPNSSESASAQMEYFFGAEVCQSSTGELTAKNSGLDFTFSKYKCLVKTAPILQATIEYYLSHNQKAEEE